MVLKRIFILSLLLLVLFWTHPMIALVVGVVVGIFFIPQYIEIIVLGVVADVVYQSSVSIAFLNIPLYTLIAFGFFMVIHILRKRMNTYA